MNVVIAGCGKIGRRVLAALSAEGHDIVAIDENENVIDDISNRYDVMCVCGNAIDPDVLEEAGTANADLFLAAGGQDETNMLACFFAKKLGARNTVARIRSPHYSAENTGFMSKSLEISMSVNPEMLTAREIFGVLKFPSALKIESFCGGKIEIVEIKLSEGSALHGMALSQMRSKYQGKILACFVRRGSEVVIPDGNFVLKSGDRVGFTGSPSEMQRFFKSLGHLKKQAKNVMIIGASKIAVYLAEMLAEIGMNVKIVEKDRAVSEKMCEILRKASIITGDGSNQQILLEEGVEQQDAFIALTGSDEANMLVSLYAAGQGVPKVITKINSEELDVMADKLGLDTVVSAKKTVANVLVRHARALEGSKGSGVETLYQITEGSAEALEFSVSAESNVTDVSLKHLKTKKNVLLAGIVRGSETIIPSGDDCIRVGDRVVVIAANHRLQDLTDILL